MRVCFVGNSHLSKYYATLEERGPEEFGGIKPSFFLERAAGTIPLTIQGSKDTDFVDIDNILLTRTRRLKCADFDVFVVVGLGFSLVSVIELWGSYRPTSDTMTGSLKHVVSDTFYEEAALSILRESKAMRVLNAIGERSDMPRVLIPQPLPMAWARNGLTDRTRVFKEIYEADRISIAGSLYERCLEEAERAGIQVARQSPDTIDSEFFTKNEFGVADITDTSKDSLFTRGDFFHANTLYAERMLSRLTQGYFIR